MKVHYVYTLPSSGSEKMYKIYKYTDRKHTWKQNTETEK